LKLIIVSIDLDSQQPLPRLGLILIFSAYQGAMETVDVQIAQQVDGIATSEYHVHRLLAKLFRVVNTRGN